MSNNAQGESAQARGPRTPSEGINQRNIKIWANVKDKICFGQRDRRRRALLQHQNFNFLFYLVWLLYTKQAQYNEGSAKLNYLLPEVYT